MSMNQLALADVLRDEAIDRVERNGKVAMLECLEWIQRAARGGEPFTSDNVWASLAGDGFVISCDPRVMGAAFREAQREGLIEPDGWEKCTRASRHGAPIRRWRAKQ